METSQELYQRITAGLSRVSLVMRHHNQIAARALGLSPLQAQALAVLRGRPAGLRLRQVARELAVTDATTSDALSTLSSKDLVTKQQDAHDHRAIRLALTPRGRQLAEKIALGPDILRAPIELLSASDADVFLGALIGIIRHLEQQGEIPLSRMCVSCRFFAPNQHQGQQKPHHCLLIKSPIGSRDVRIDCPDFEAPDKNSRSQIWEQFIHSSG